MIDCKKEQKKKILIIAPLPPPINGVSLASEILIDSQLIRMFDISIINLSSKQRRGISGTFNFFRMINLVVLILSTFWKCIIWKPDIVYLTITQTTLGFLRDMVFVNITEMFNAKCIIHLHGGYFKIFYNKSNSLFQWLIENTLNKIDRVIVLDSSLKNIFEGFVRKENIVAIPNCVPENSIITKERIERKLSELQDKFTNNGCLNILYMSGLFKEKGYLDLIRAIKILHDRCIREINVNIAGEFIDRREEQNSKEYVKANGLKEKINFHGIVYGKKKRKLFLKSDIFVLPTYLVEGQPIAILEAMANGLAIITTKYRTKSSMIEEGENGIFVNPKSPEEIASAIRRFIENPEMIYRMGKNNIKKIRKKYTEQKYINSFIKLFSEV